MTVCVCVCVCVFVVRIIDERNEAIVDDRYKYTDTEYPPAPTRFDPFRPAGTRSFYVR